MGRTQRDGQDGAALVEFAFVSILLFLIVFGIIEYGVMLSFRHTMTESAADAARTAAVLINDPLTVADDRYVAARGRIDEIQNYGRTCANGMECVVTIHECDQPAPSVEGPPILPNLATPDCITVALRYPYGSDPIIPSMPFLPLPGDLEVSATSQLTQPAAPPVQP